MKIKDLKKIIENLEAEHGNIDNCDINYRFNNDSEVMRLNHLEEDLFDSETNNILDSVVFLNNINH
tara:strand:+ start:3565 stop:3762 length:198 start_codon:yes stop_codon:yes gene_type:complete